MTLPRTRPHFTPIALAALLALAGCAPRTRAPQGPTVEDVTPAFLATRAAADPQIAAEPGRVAITWAERSGEGWDAWFSASSDSGAHWSEPLRLNAVAGRVSSYAESRPALAMGPQGLVAVAWPAKRDSGEYADDVMVRASRDGGATFGAPQLANDDHGDPRSTYHGFLALDARPDGAWIVSWIDGRTAAAAGQEGEPVAAEIWSSTSSDGGRSWSANVRVADSVCACCRVAMRAGQGNRVALVYRTARGNRRDPRLALSRDGGASWPLDTLLSDDGWLLNGCPSHGPAVSLFAGGGHVAWYTGAAGSEGVWAATWRDDGGVEMGRHAFTEGLREAERPLLAGWGRGALAGVLGRPEADTSRRVFAVRALGEDGGGSPWTLLGARAKTAALAADAPRHAWACWVEQTGDGPRMRVARLAMRP